MIEDGDNVKYEPEPGESSRRAGESEEEWRARNWPNAEPDIERARVMAHAEIPQRASAAHNEEWAIKAASKGDYDEADHYYDQARERELDAGDDAEEAGRKYDEEQGNTVQSVAQSMAEDADAPPPHGNINAKHWPADAQHVRLAEDPKSEPAEPET